MAVDIGGSSDKNIEEFVTEVACKSQRNQHYCFLVFECCTFPLQAKP